MPPSPSRYVPALLLGLLLSASTSSAATPVEEKQEPAADRSLKINHLVSAGYNPKVGEYRARIGYWQRLGQSEELLWRKTHLSLGGQVRLNPAGAGMGPLVEWQPLSVFNLRALVEATGFFGTFGQLQSYRSPLEEHSDAIRDDNVAARYSTMGWHAMLQPTLQVQVGPMVVQSMTTFDYQDLRLKNGDSVWYEAGPDALLPNRGWTLTEELRLTYLAGPLTVSTLWRYFLPLYSPEHFRLGEQAPAALNSNMRLGLLAAYTFSGDDTPHFQRPSVFVSAQWHLRHRYRVGSQVPQGLPFMVLGFTFQQDFIL